MWGLVTGVGVGVGVGVCVCVGVGVGNSLWFGVMNHVLVGVSGVCTSRVTSS